MASYEVAKSSKLTFKGESTKKKKKHKHKRKVEEVEKADLIHGRWWPITSLEEFKGPVILQWHDGRYLFAEVSATFKAGDLRDTDDPEGFDPAEVFTVVQAGSGQIGLKSGYDRYLGTNSSGKLTGYAEAIGQLEMWIPELDEGMVHLKSSIGKYMTLQEDGTVRCEEKEQGQSTAMRVWSGETPPSKKQKGDGQGDLKSFEKDAAKRFQSYMGRGYEGLDKEGLKKARKEGKLSEALLDRREKGKADRYCK